MKRLTSYLLNMPSNWWRAVPEKTQRPVRRGGLRNYAVRGRLPRCLLQYEFSSDSIRLRFPF